MNFRNNNNFPKSIFLVSLLVVSIASLGVILPNASANHDSITQTMDPTFEIIPFRNHSTEIAQKSAVIKFKLILEFAQNFMSSSDSLIFLQKTAHSGLLCASKTLKKHDPHLNTEIHPCALCEGLFSYENIG